MSQESKRILLQIFLFLATLVTTTFAGAEWCFGKPLYVLLEDQSIGFNPAYTWNDFLLGMQFSIPFLLILTVHEFGHYFTAMYHKVKSSLPYYIPIPPIPYFPSLIGTMGAVIRIRSRVQSNLQHFDIGLAGPLAGFIVAFGLLWYGFSTLPSPEYVFEFHPEYKTYGLNYADYVYDDEYLRQQNEGKGGVDVLVGGNLLFTFFETFVADPARMPNPHELMHYPLLLAGFIALFFTSLNLLPIGQLDGGHIVYGLFGRKGHRIIATVFFILLIFYSALGTVNVVRDRDSLYWMIPLAIGFYYFCFKGLNFSSQTTLMISVLVFAAQFVITWQYPGVTGYEGWLLFAFVIGRFIGVQHPPSEIEQPLDSKRIVLGWLSLFIFVISFSPVPLVLRIVG
jgi:membrane-associated protease RseP (regulator of RpoE activity)